MCGIFGYTLDPKRAEKAFPVAKREKLVLALARGNTRRGHHAWGAYTFTDGQGELAKGVGPMDMVPGLSTLALAHTLMAHTRYATTGAVTEENAHPFHIGNVVGAHNGMIYNHAEMAEKYQRTCAVDSMHLFHHVNEGRSFEEFEGYGAVEYARTDGNAAEIFLCRMQRGELAIYGLGPREKPYGVVWSSSEEHLREAFKAAGVKGFPYTVKTGRVYSASPNGVLYKTDTEHTLSETRTITAADLARTRGNASGAVARFDTADRFFARNRHSGGAQHRQNTAGAPTKAPKRTALTSRETGIQGVGETPKPGVHVEPDLVETDLFMLTDEEQEQAAAEWRAALREGRLC